MSTQSTYETLVVAPPVDGVTVAQLNRPDRMNALTPRMFEEFSALQQEVDADTSSRVLILTGSGRAFCAGLDLDDAAVLPDMPAALMLAQQDEWAAAVTGFNRMKKPVIAAVNGAAAGGGMALALAADIRIASTDAMFNAAHVRVGLSGGDVGISWSLPRTVGLGRAIEILLTGRNISVQEALSIGLVTSLVPPEELLAGAMAIAGQICGNSPFGMALTKRVVHLNADAPSLEAALAVENRNQVLATRTADMREALAARREKRPPRFVGY